MRLSEKYLPYYTVKDWKNWDGDWELIEGIPYPLVSPSIEHQRVVAKLLVAINQELEKCKNNRCEVLPDIDYYISEDTVVRLDVLVVCEDITEKLTVPPTIIFEVISPSSIKMDEHIKFELYQQEGVKYYVLIYPFKDRKHIKVFELKDYSYKKVFETVKENFLFHLRDCDLKIDFSKIWK